jgi:hypothetical protein
MPGPALLLALALLGAGPAPRDDGYRGIWYANQATGDEYAYKYSGGFATYPQQHVPIAIHAPAARKTFFVWGGRPPTDPGPEPFGAGGEVVMWKSPDRGETWTRVKALTEDSPRNHTYVRRPIDAHPDFAYLWADGGTRSQTESALYFTDAAGSRVWKLPTRMTGATAAPEPIR